MSVAPAKELDAEACRVIDFLGGTTKTALLCKVSPAAVAQWRENGIPDARLMFLKLACPTAFGETRRRKPLMP